MIQEVKMYTIFCDICGCDVNEGSEFAGWNDKSYLEDVAQEEGWKKLDDKHYCTECFEYDDDDELVIFDKKENAPETKGQDN
jgi:hypothetical protein